jgi:alkanesulfonate monooxygenase SsuD/methylene tetrahydromethanopterin reductase-like flavin-dependent oxidoreductase (luciferase family)
MAQPVLDRVPAVATRHVPAAPHRAVRAAVVRPAPVPRPLAPVVEAPSAPSTARPVPAADLPVARTATIHVRTPDYGVRTVEFRPGSESAVAQAAARADVIRLGFSVVVPSVGALARVVALVEEEIAATGRDRAEVRVLLDVDVVLAADERTARRKRSHLEYLDALAGLSWSPAATRVVTTADRLAAEVHELAERTGVDGVVLHPLAGGDEADARVRALVA